MDLKRIQNVVDIEKIKRSRVTVVGIGGSMSIIGSLIRCGLGGLIAIDPDTVDATNVARQGHHEIGVKKVRAAERSFRQINPQLDYLGLPLRHDQIQEMQWKELLQGTDLLILATDSFEAQAFGNRLALSMEIPALWIGLYAGAKAGEIVWWTPNHKDCFRCLLEWRFLSQQESKADPGSDDALIQDLQIVDGIAGHIALGLLTQGSDNYFGRLIEHLGERQFLQIKLRHDWLLNGVDPVAKALQIPANNESYVCWSAATRVNGPRLFACPDCQEFLGRKFDSEDVVAVEVSNSTPEVVETDRQDADGLGL